MGTRSETSEEAEKKTMNNFIEKTLAQFERLDKSEALNVILMTTRQHDEMTEYFRHRNPQDISVRFELQKLNGIELQHFETMAEVYERAAKLLRDGRNVGVIPEPPVTIAGHTIPVKFDKRSLR